MDQELLAQVQTRISQLKDLKSQLEDTKKQISDKEHEIFRFDQEWKNNCKHVFYRVQYLTIVPYTIGYHCCLCGTNLPYTHPAHSRRASRSASSLRYPKKRYSSNSKPYLPPPQEETEDFIGTVIDCIDSDGKTEEERFPIPPKYQAEVNCKKMELDKIKAEEKALVEKLETLKTTVKTLEEELNEIAHLLNSLFGYPEIVIRAPTHWTRDDFNYDPFY